VAETIQQQLRERINDQTPAVRHRSGELTWHEHLDEAARHAAAVLGIVDSGAPVHIGVLLGNSTHMLTAMAAAGLGGHVLCGINTTRRGAALARDIRHADCQMLLTDSAHRELLDGLALPGVRIIDVDSTEWRQLLAAAGPFTPHREVGPMDTFMLIFTSGTSGDPKAVQVPHVTVLLAGAALAQRFEITTDDVCYLSMPLFHSNAVLAGWSVAVCSGAAMVPATFSASRLVHDVRTYGVTYLNYVGKPLAYVLATPERPDDSDNPLRVAFGNEASDRDIAEFGRRFGCTVWDGFGSTEGAVTITREEGCPPGSVGKGFPGVAIYDPATGTECAIAEFDASGALLNADAAVGELVNTTGSGMFQGYYKDPAATDNRLRDGMYWSGDLAYRDADGWIYLAGRTADWMRVDGENMTAAPIERIVLRHPAVSQVAIYPVPDETVGDQIMAAIVLHSGAELTPAEFEGFLSGQDDLSPKAWPRHVWITAALPATATNKVLKRDLIAQGVTPPDGVHWVRDSRGRAYFDARALHQPAITRGAAEVHQSGMRSE